MTAAFRATFTASGGRSGASSFTDDAQAWAWLYAQAVRHGDGFGQAISRADFHPLQPFRVEHRGHVYTITPATPENSILDMVKAEREAAADAFTASPFNAVTVALREAHRQALATTQRAGLPAWQSAEARRLAAMCEAALAGRGYAVTVKEGHVQDVTASGPHAFDELADNLGGHGAFASSWKFYDVKPGPLA